MDRIGWFRAGSASGGTTTIGDVTTVYSTVSLEQLIGSHRVAGGEQPVEKFYGAQRLHGVV